MAAATKVTVEVEGRRMVLSNLEKPLYPSGFRKGEVIGYYSRIAPALLPHLTGRPLTVTRWPDGTAGPSFFAKNVPAHAPGWLRTVELPVPGSTKGRETIDFVVCDDLPTLVWLANLASLEMHVPQWRVGPRGGVRPPDRLVIDLDPGAPATIVACAQVALLVRERLTALGHDAVAKTSGSKGMQLATTWSAGDPSAAARALAEQLERDHPEQVVSRMLKVLRPGKVLLDWSQNNPAKTTVAAWSLRARERPTVSTPVTWAEVAGCARSGRPLVFDAAQALARWEADGDPWAALEL